MYFLQVIEVDDECFNITCGKPIKTVLSSQYCHGTLMRLRNELIETAETASSFNYYSSDRSATPCPTVVNAEVCDVREFYATCESHHEAEYNAFCTIKDALQRLNVSQDLLLVGYPLLTQFSVNLLCVMKRVFGTVREN